MNKEGVWEMGLGVRRGMGNGSVNKEGVWGMGL